MTSLTRLARAAACAALLAVPAGTLAAEATIRIEGTRGTVLPEAAYVLPDAGSSLVIRDTGDDDAMSVGGRTAAAQLGNASRLYGVGFSFTDWGAWGFALDSIGSDPSDWNSGPAWFIKHNHRLADEGAGSLVLADGDEVLWALSPIDSSWNMALGELAVTAPSAPMVAGQAFQVRVHAYDNAGTRTAAPGVSLTYAGTTVTTDDTGSAMLTATGAGPAELRASRPGSVRDSARICVHPADDPSVCDLPLLPKATMPEGAAAGTTAAGADGTVRLQVTVRIGGADLMLTAAVPLPEPDGRPVAIRRQMISGADLSPAEMRRAMGAAASALAAALNEQAARGNTALWLPSGVTWQASWLSGTPYVVPLRRGEALFGAASGGPRNTRGMHDRAGDLQRHMRRCDLEGTVALTRRHGYALAVLAPASLRDDLVECVGGRS